MTQKQIEGNVLIAIFDGYIKCAEGYINKQGDKVSYGYGVNSLYEKGANYIHASEMEYHSSWDWLMPACYKWDNLFKEIILEYPKAMEYEELCDALDTLVSCYEITPAFNQLVENIKWYNQYIANK